MTITDTHLLMVAIGTTAWALGVLSSSILEFNGDPDWLLESCRDLNLCIVIVAVIAWIGWLV